jgi:hypothetical protein
VSYNDAPGGDNDAAAAKNDAPASCIVAPADSNDARFDCIDAPANKNDAPARVPRLTGNMLSTSVFRQNSSVFSVSAFQLFSV